MTYQLHILSFIHNRRHRKPVALHRNTSSKIIFDVGGVGFTQIEPFQFRLGRIRRSSRKQNTVAPIYRVPGTDSATGGVFFLDSSPTFFLINAV